MKFNNKFKYIILFLIIIIPISLLLLLQPKQVNVPSIEGPMKDNSFLNGTTSTINKSNLKMMGTSSIIYFGRNRSAGGKISSSLPYPRIEIDYSFRFARSIRNDTADTNHTYQIVSMEIRNYGYKYFDAYPGLFRLGSNEPLINVSTGDMIDAVVPNSSMTSGDLIFYTGRNQMAYSSNLNYLNNNYKIIYHRGIKAKIQNTNQNTNQNTQNDLMEKYP